MGIYDSFPGLDIGPESQKKIMFAGIAVLAIIIVAALVFFASEMFGPQPVKMEFQKNPIKPNETTMAIVKVMNVDKLDAVYVPVSLEPKEQSEFDTRALDMKFDGTIGAISSGDSREITFVINPIGTIIPGTYTFVAKAKINGKEYVKEGQLRVEASN